MCLILLGMRMLLAASDRIESGDHEIMRLDIEMCDVVLVEMGYGGKHLRCKLFFDGGT